jgi:hypothetical protein
MIPNPAIEKGFINQLTISVNTKPFGCLVIRFTEEKSTLTIIGKIIIQIKKAIKKLTLAYSNLEISTKIFGNIFPPIVPMIIDNNTQIDKYFSNFPNLTFFGIFY